MKKLHYFLFAAVAILGIVSIASAFSNVSVGGGSGSSNPTVTPLILNTYTFTQSGPGNSNITNNNLSTIPNIATTTLNTLTVGSSTPLTLLGISDFVVYGTTTMQTPINNNQAFRILNAATSTIFVVDTKNGNVGIGTTTPTSNLAVQGNGLISGNLNVANITATGTITAGILSVTNNVSGSLDVGSNLRVYGGTISLGASPNTATTTLVANGSGQLTVSSAGTNQNVVLTPSGTGFTLLNGNVGLGTTTPIATLSIASAGNTNMFAVGSTSASNFLIDKNGNVIMNSGNVGIGTTGPNAKLDVNGGNLQLTSGVAGDYPTRTTNIVFVRTDVPTTYLNAITNSNSSTLTNDTMSFELANGASTRATVMTLLGNGNVGIGTTSSSGLFSLTGNNNPFQIYVSSTTATAASTTMFAVDRAGDIHLGGGTPTLSSCGTGPTLGANSTDQAGTVTVGTTAGGCTVSFSTAKNTIPHCVVSEQTMSLTNSLSYTESASALTLTETTFGGVVFDYVCALGH